MDDFNSIVNGILDPLLDNEYAIGALRLFLAVYGAKAVPQLPPSWAPYVASTWARLLVMSLIIWIANKDPATAIMIAVCYYLTVHYVLKNGLAQIAQTGIVPQEISDMLSGALGPSIKPQSVVQAEATLMQQSVNSSRASGYLTAPESLLSSGPTSTGANAAIPSIPSGTPSTSSSMMATQPEGGVPHAFVPDDLHDLALAPK